MRLLLVEDNEELAQLLRQRLAAAGYETDLLTAAGEAQSALATTRYAAMVLDLGLPDGDGLSILRQIRQREDPLPVLVLTARGGLQDRVSGLRSGADDYLVKPFAFEELIARLEALLRRRKDRVVAKRLVEDHVSGPSRDVASNAVEVSIHRLRKQLSERGAKVQIHTIRGVGYLMSEEKDLSP